GDVDPEAAFEVEEAHGFGKVSRVVWQADGHRGGVAGRRADIVVESDVREVAVRQRRDGFEHNQLCRAGGGDVGEGRRRLVSPAGYREAHLDRLDRGPRQGVRLGGRGHCPGVAGRGRVDVGGIGEIERSHLERVLSGGDYDLIDLEGL